MAETNPKTPTPEHPLSRRRLLRGLVGLGVGAAVGGLVTPPLSKQVSETTTAITGIPSGNASVNRAIEAVCGPQPTPECIDEKFLTPDKIRNATITDPIIEEVIFRALPILIADRGRGVERLLFGHGLVKPTRRHLLAGAVSSVVFGLSHSMNFSTGSFNANIIPASQIMGGFINYGLAYTFGVPASMVAHGVHNAAVTPRLTAK